MPSELRLKYVAIYSSNKFSERPLCLPLYDHTKTLMNSVFAYTSNGRAFGQSSMQKQYLCVPDNSELS